MESYAPEAWANFYVATAGAAAALAGLVMVAVSVNIARIVENERLPPRALGAISTLLLILLVSAVGLMPQPMHAFALRVLQFSVIAWVVQIWLSWTIVRHKETRNRPVLETLFAVVSGQMQTIPFLVGSVMMMTGDGGGIQWIAHGILLTFILSVVSAWILLVEILR